jgi:hypothetical protein
MTRKLLVLSCAAAALVGGAALAQDTAVNPPAQTDLETSVQNANEPDRTAPADPASTASDETAVAGAPLDQPLAEPSVNDDTSIAETTTTTADTPSAANASAVISNAQVSTDGVWTTQSQGAGAVGVNPQTNALLAQHAEQAQTPSSQPASATVGSLASASIANAPNGVFKADVGAYPMSHYASPSRPLPYDQVDAYLRASPSQQLAQNWWAGTELASTAAASDVSASTPAASDVSSTTSSASGGTAGLPGDTRVGLNSDTSNSDSTSSSVTPSSETDSTLSTDANPVPSPSTSVNPAAPDQETTSPSGSTTP